MAEQWWWSWPAPLRSYAVLLRLFVEGRISGDEFEVLFLQLYKQDPTAWDEDRFDALNGLFYAVDDYCGDDELRREAGGIDEAVLRRVATEVWQRLRKLGGSASDLAD